MSKPQSFAEWAAAAFRSVGFQSKGWTPNPGAGFYVAYNDNLNRNGFNPFTGNYEPGLHRNERTFFVKMSYLFRRRI